MEEKLGMYARDTVTGFDGVVTGRVEFETGCIRYQVTPDRLIEGKMPEAVWIDEVRCEFVEQRLKFKPIVHSAKGGPGPAPVKNSVMP